MRRERSGATYSAPSQGYVTEINPGDVGQEAPQATVRFSARLRRSLGMIAAVSLLGGGAALATDNEAPAAHPEPVNSASIPHHVYRTGGDGVWLHESPGLQAPKEVVMPEGAEFDVACWQASDVVAGDGIWLEGSYDGHQGAATDYYIDDHWQTTADFGAQGIPECGSAANIPPGNSDIQPAAPVQNFNADPSNDNQFNRQRSVNWALANAQAQPPSTGSCTWFVSQALWQGGLAKTNEWTSDGSHGIDFDFLGYHHDNRLPGTKDAWVPSDLRDYLLQTYPNSQYIPLHFDDTKAANEVPQAQPGDIIFYDWGQKDSNGASEGITHATVVTNIAEGGYPEVSEWSVQTDGTRPSPYAKRGWSWSDLSNQWLANKYPSIKAYLLHIEVKS